MQNTNNQLILTQMLRTYVAGQQRTANRKQFVLLADKYIMKGPYWSGQEKKVETISLRSNFFKSWSTPCVTLPLGTMNSDCGAFICYANLAEGYPIEFTPHRESFSGYEYNVLKRVYLDKLNNAWAGIQPWIDTCLPGLLLALCHCYILGVGDTGMCNILADTQKRCVYLIDYDESRDEHRGFTTTDVDARGDIETFYFSKPPGKKYNWVQKVRPYYPYVLQELAKIAPSLVDPSMQKRYQQCVSILSQYGTGVQTVVCGMPGGVSGYSYAIPTDSGSSSDLFVQTQSGMGFQGSTTYHGSMATQGFTANEGCSSNSTVTTVTTAQTPVTAAATAQTTTVQQYVPSNVDQRRYAGRLGGSQTYHGIPIDIAKSGMQKAVRRGQQEWALMYLFELLGLGSMEPSGAVITNTYNRLAVCAAEDVGLAQLDVTLAIIDRVNQRDKGDHKLPIPNAELAAMTQLLCASRKTRVCSHIWRSYVDSQGVVKARSRGIDNVINTAYYPSQNQYGQVGQVTQGWQGGYGGQAVPGSLSLNQFESMLTEISMRSYPRTVRMTDFKVFTAAWQFLNETEVAKYTLPAKHMKTSLGKTGGWTSHPSILLWNIMRRFASARILDILATAYYKQSETRPFLALAILCCIYNTDPELTLANIPALASQWENCQYLNNLANHQYDISLHRVQTEQPYVIDKHTAAGKRMGGTVADFVVQGAVVTNEDERFIFPILQELYRDRTDF